MIRINPPTATPAGRKTLPLSRRITCKGKGIPQADTSQALNRYAYVKNNPLRFTDPTGHSFWDTVKEWIGTILTVALTPWLGPIAASIIGSAVGAAVNGGTWKSFAIGVGIGIAAGGLASGLGSAVNGGGFWAGAASYFADGTSIAVLVGDFAAGVITGAVAGGNWGNNIGQGAMGGAIGAAVGMATRAILNSPFMKPTMDILKEIASKINRGLELTQAIIGDMIYGPLDEITIWGAGKDDPNSWRKIDVKVYRYNNMIQTSYALGPKSIHTFSDTVNDLRFMDENYPSVSATPKKPMYDDLRDTYGNTIRDTGYYNIWAERHIAHEIGHTCQASKLGIFYLPLVAPPTKFVHTPFLNHFENDASRRGLYGGIVK